MSVYWHFTVYLSIRRILYKNVCRRKVVFSTRARGISPPVKGGHKFTVGTVQFSVGDLNGDGIPDIVIGNKKGAFVFLSAKE